MFTPRILWKGTTPPDLPEDALVGYVVELRHRIDDLKTRLIATRLSLISIENDTSGGIRAWVAETAEHGMTRPVTRRAAEMFGWLAHCLTAGTEFSQAFEGLDASISFIDGLLMDLRFIADGYVPCGLDHATPPATCVARLTAWLRTSCYADGDDDEFAAVFGPSEPPEDDEDTG